MTGPNVSPPATVHDFSEAKVERGKFTGADVADHHKRQMILYNYIYIYVYCTYIYLVLPNTGKK